MTVVTRMQIFCDGQDCKVYFPADGPIDGKIVTMTELREVARDFGWTLRRKASTGGFGHCDLCPTCTAKPGAAA